MKKTFFYSTVLFLLLFFALADAKSEASKEENNEASWSNKWNDQWINRTSDESSNDLDDGWEEDWEDDWEEEPSWLFSGSVGYSFAERLSADPRLDNPNADVLDETRFQLSFDAEGEIFSFHATLDGWHDNVLRSTEAEFRELQLDFELPLSSYSATQFSGGRQAVTWGTGDLVFLNDNFAKDWVSFFSGREDEYLKAPMDALRINHDFQWFIIDMVWSSEHHPDTSISGQRFSFFAPQPANPQAYAPLERNDGEWALRAYKNFNGVEYALYFYRGAQKQAKNVNRFGQAEYGDKEVWGASVRGTLLGGIYAAEIAHHRGEDRSGLDSLRENDQWRYLLSYEHELAKNLNFSMQYYVEKTEDYHELIQHSPWPQFEQVERRELVTGRLSYSADKGKWLWSLFSFYSPSDHDSYLRPQVSYRPNDQWLFRFGANHFSGRESHSFFGQFEKASNWYLSAKYQF